MKSEILEMIKTKIPTLTHTHIPVYIIFQIFHRSKLANILMTRELESRESGHLRFHSVDPGFTWTDIHTSQLPFLHSWIVWVAGPLLGARCKN